MTLSSEEQRVFAELTAALDLRVRFCSRSINSLSVALFALGSVLLTATFTRWFLLGCTGYLMMLGGALLGARALPGLRGAAAAPNSSRYRSMRTRLVR